MDKIGFELHVTKRLVQTKVNFLSCDEQRSEEEKRLHFQSKKHRFNSGADKHLSPW